MPRADHETATLLSFGLRCGPSLDGSSWQPAELDAHDSDYGFRVFRKKVQVTPGTLTIGSRATDRTGATQPKDPVWNPSGYLHNAVDLATVEVRA